LPCGQHSGSFQKVGQISWFFFFYCCHLSQVLSAAVVKATQDEIGFEIFFGVCGGQQIQQQMWLPFMNLPKRSKKKWSLGVLPNHCHFSQVHSALAVETSHAGISVGVFFSVRGVHQSQQHVWLLFRNLPKGNIPNGLFSESGHPAVNLV